MRVRLDRSIYVLLVAAILAGLWRFFPFLVQDAALGYDAGLYMKYFWLYAEQFPLWNFNVLPEWIQRMYPPFLGMLVSSSMMLTGLSAEWFVTWGVGILSISTVVPLYILVRDQTGSTTMAIWTSILYLTSFVQWYVFWRGYMKQLLGVFLLLWVLVLWGRKAWGMSIVLLVMAFLTHRPALLYVFLVVVVWCVAHIISKKDSREIGMLVGTMLAAGCISLLVYYPLLEELFYPLVSKFFTAIDVPTLDHARQAGGTFLTTKDLLKTNWWILLCSLGGIGYARKYKKAEWLHIGWRVGTVWVFGQGFFFQRFMGYADIFWIAMAGVCLGWVWETKKRRGYILCLAVLGIHVWTYQHYMERLWKPLIEPAEFAIINEMPSILPSQAIVVAPGVDYGPWIYGRGKRDIITPGGYSLSTRGNVDPGWRRYRWEQDTAGKCNALEKYYGGLERPLYMREGSKTVYLDGKQIRSDIKEGDCFERILSGKQPDRALRKIHF